MAVYNIPIYGLIGSPENTDDKAMYFQFNDLLLHINKAKSYDTLNLDIASNGGYCDVADKMIDTIKATGKFITSCNSGNVASASSKIFTIAPKDFRTFYPQRGNFLIHNPWTNAEGDATELASISKQLKSVENEYAAWYAMATGSDEDIIKAFMAENVPLTPEQIESLGFAKIVQSSVKAFAKLKSNFKNDMESKEVVEKLNGFEKLLAKLFAKLKIKALMLSDANGKELEFPEINDVSEINVGVKVLESGAPANGEYTQPDGSVYKCENGVLVEIIPVAGNDNVEALKTENAALKTELEALKAEKVSAEAKVTEAISAVTEVKAEFTKFKAQFSGATFKSAIPEIEVSTLQKSRKPFKTV